VQKGGGVSCGHAHKDEEQQHRGHEPTAVGGGEEAQHREAHGDHRHAHRLWDAGRKKYIYRELYIYIYIYIYIYRERERERERIRGRDVGKHSVGGERKPSTAKHMVMTAMLIVCGAQEKASSFAVYLYRVNPSIYISYVDEPEM